MSSRYEHLGMATDKRLALIQAGAVLGWLWDVVQGLAHL